jgi:thioredoxin 1
MKRTSIAIFISAVVLLVLIGCKGDSNGSVTKNESQIQTITSVEQFNTILESSGNRLLAFDLFADWCMPCKVLSPTLDEIAREKAGKISLFKINTDEFPQITEAFGVTGIPFVVFVKNRQALYALLGVQPKETYLQIIDMYADSTDNQMDIQPDGNTVEGLRVIQIDPRHRKFTKLRNTFPPELSVWIDPKAMWLFTKKGLFGPFYL